jgi:hypothetical protein
MNKKDIEKAKEFHKKLVNAKNDLPNRVDRLNKAIENGEVKGTVIIKGDELFKGFDKND